MAARVYSSTWPVFRPAGLRAPLAIALSLPCSGVKSVSRRSASPKSWRRRMIASVRNVRSGRGIARQVVRPKTMRQEFLQRKLVFHTALGIGNDHQDVRGEFVQHL